MIKMLFMMCVWQKAFHKISAVVTAASSNDTVVSVVRTKKDGLFALV